MCCFISSGDFSSCAQGSYWAIDTNPKEDALPTRPKKRPRSGERVSVNRNKIPAFSFFSNSSLTVYPRLHVSGSVLLFVFLFFFLSLPSLPFFVCARTLTHRISRGSSRPASVHLLLLAASRSRRKEEGSLLINDAAGSHYIHYILLIYLFI